RSDLGRTGARPRRSRDRALERVRRLPTELGSPEQAAHAAPPGADADAPPCAARKAYGGECERCPAGQRQAGVAGRIVQARAWQRSWRDRPDRLWQVIACAPAGRGVATGPRQDSARWLYV